MRHPLLRLVTVCLMIGGFLCAPAAAAPASRAESMFQLYEANRKEGIPNYVTEDFILLAYGMAVNETITDVEETVLLPRFRALVEGLLARLKAAGSEDGPALANRDFISVVHALLTGAEGPGGAANPEAAAQELRKVREAAGIARSDLMRQTLDYSQFKVRGKYTRSDELGWYFRAVRYAGAVLFPVKASQATGITPADADFLTQQAVGLVRLLDGDERLKAHRADLENRLRWLFGPPDDLTTADYLAVIGKSGEKAPAEIRAALYKRAEAEGRKPRILSGIVQKEGLEKGTTPRDVLTGWRFIPQRYTPDAAVFQQLVYDQVGKYQGQKNPFTKARIEGKEVKGFPTGLELMALLGSDRADERLRASDDRNYEGYQEAAKKAEKLLGEALAADGLLPDHLRAIHYWLVRGEGEGGKADPSRRLNTALAFWTWNRYINLLYAKQSTTLAGKGLDMGPEDQRTIAWLAPAPELYLHLSRTAGAMADFLQGAAAGGEGPPKGLDRLNRLVDILEQCRRIAAAELLSGKPVPGAAPFLNEIDTALLALAGEKDGPVVADVHTEPTSQQVLQEAIGFPEATTRKVGGKELRGARFTYYEFKFDMNDRLTDEAWREMLEDPAAMKKLETSPGTTARK